MKKWVKILLVLVLIGAIAGGVIYYYATKGTASAKDAKPVASFTSASLFKTITENPKGFIEKYTLPKDDLQKIISVKGVISKITTQDPKSSSIEINTADMNIIFSWDESRISELNGLKEGAEIDIKGIVASINGFDNAASADPMDLESQKEAKFKKCCLNQ